MIGNNGFKGDFSKKNFKNLSLQKVLSIYIICAYQKGRFMFRTDGSLNITNKPDVKDPYKIETVFEEKKQSQNHTFSYSYKKKQKKFVSFFKKLFWDSWPASIGLKKKCFHTTSTINQLKQQIDEIHSTLELLKKMHTKDPIEYKKIKNLNLPKIRLATKQDFKATLKLVMQNKLKILQKEILSHHEHLKTQDEISEFFKKKNELLEKIEKLKEISKRIQHE